MIDRERIVEVRNGVYRQLLDANYSLQTGGDKSSHFYNGRASALVEVWKALSELLGEGANTRRE